MGSHLVHLQFKRPCSIWCSAQGSSCFGDECLVSPCEGVWKGLCTGTWGKCSETPADASQSSSQSFCDCPELVKRDVRYSRAQSPSPHHHPQGQRGSGQEMGKPRSAQEGWEILPQRTSSSSCPRLFIGRQQFISPHPGPPHQGPASQPAPSGMLSRYYLRTGPALMRMLEQPSESSGCGWGGLRATTTDMAWPDFKGLCGWQVETTDCCFLGYQPLWRRNRCAHDFLGSGALEIRERGRENSLVHAFSVSKHN